MSNLGNCTSIKNKKFSSLVVSKFKCLSCPGFDTSFATYIIQNIKSTWERESNFFALEVLYTLRHHLKSFLEFGENEAPDRLDTALLHLLKRKPSDFLHYVKDPVISNVFKGCSFVQIQDLAKLAEYLHNEIPTECISLLHNELATNDETKFKILSATKNFDVEKYSQISYNNAEDDDNEDEPLNETNVNVTDSLEWLKEEYRKHKNLLAGLSWEEFSESLLQILRSNKSDDELQNDLIEMLGFDLFEMVIDILNKRMLIVNAFLTETKDAADTKNVASNKFEKVSKLERQEDFNLTELDDIVSQLNLTENELIELGFANDLCYFQSQPKPPSIEKISKVHVQPSNLNIHDIHQDVIKKMMICGQIANVPFDAAVKHTELFDEITIPPRKVDTPLETVEKVSVSSLDSIGKMIFKDIEHFNYIQSEVFDVAYNTNENMLVCAPTGSGKTNIALLTIVNQIKRFIEHGVLHLDKFKIVYICPMKALAAEMALNFSKKLDCLGVTVKELTGDIQMSRKEILETQMLVTTPEKWDVISRKGTADAELTNLLKLLIIDEVHLLNTDRGPVIEALVARTLRQVITTQNMIRIVGLSATLPSYTSVAQFLRVNPDVGLFFFDNRYRSVPLVQTFVGLKSSNKSIQASADLDEICFNKVVSFLKNNHQVLVFVHARNQTVRTAKYLMDTASKKNKLELFQPPDNIKAKKAKWEAESASNKLIDELLAHGLGVHHAGMLRRDRSATEKHFINGTIKVLVCTATLAWGVNLPAHGVIIKGTEIYDSKKGSFVDLDILDVLQIFGRAGRPQFDTSGHGIIITTNEKVHFYLSALTNQLPIESNLLKALPDNLNAEIVLGTISNIQEAVEWLTFTYIYQRMRLNPHIYGLLPNDIAEDPSLRGHLLSLVHCAAEYLDRAHMIRYDTNTGELIATYLGRTASYFYVTLETIESFNEHFKQFMSEGEIIYMMCSASEFSSMQVRPDELENLDELVDLYCEFNISCGVENTIGKVYVLMQTFLSRGYIKSVSLASDMEYINQSAVRIARALFDIAIHRNQAMLAGRCLLVAQCFEQQMWPFQTPIRQFHDIPLTVIETIENSHINIQHLKDMDIKDLGHVTRNHRTASLLKRCIDSFPVVEIDSTLHPITRGVLRVKLFITPKFVWNDKFHGKACENFWLWVEDPDNDMIYHSETCAITKAVCTKGETLQLVFTVPLIEPRPTQYLVRISSDRWMHATHTHALSFRDLHIPTSFTPHTELLELRPLSIEALGNPIYQSLYTFSHFNPVQTQIFHCLYHRDENVLLGAPTGSGKTIAAEICIFRLLNKQQNLKVVYIAPLKALVRERVEDWTKRFGKVLGKKVIEMTGDVTPNASVIKNADLIITTPEKWDGLSRGWQNRRYIQQVGLIIIDEIHLLGEDRGPVLEVIVSRINFIASQTGIKPRLIGLSTAMANAGNLGNWLGIKEMGLYNFRPSVRPVPLDVHINGFPGKHYCPRMISMNRPAYQAIRQFAPNSPTLIFCSSRKQTRLTAIDLITYLLTDADSKRWLNCEEQVIEYITADVTDNDLRHFLLFGIGIHHAGLQEKDRKLVEELFVNQKIQVLIATATLAWGVNFPAHLVVIKGTEYFDGKTKRYVDMPITDILQMMGRAGRPQYDTSGVACVFVQDVKKNFYKKFLYEPFPIESNLMQVLPDHINAEIASGTITSKDKLLEYMTSTYFFRRLLENPSYYNLQEIEPYAVQQFLSELVDSVIQTLCEYGCVTVNDEETRSTYEITFYGQISSYYYLSYKTMKHFHTNIKDTSSIMDLIKVMCHTEEYATFPVRHNEDKINKQIADLMKFDLQGESCESAPIKVVLLIHAYLTNFPFPNQEYTVDFKSAMDQALRILQAMTDVASNSSWLSCTIKIIQIMQMLTQGQYLHMPTVLTIPHVTTNNMQSLQREIRKNTQLQSLSLMALKMIARENRNALERALLIIFNSRITKEILNYLANLPLIDFKVSIVNTDQSFSRNKIVPIKLNAKTSYQMELSLNRFGPNNLNVESCRFPKKKEEGWFICLGDIDSDTLVQIKRVTVVKRSTCSLSFDTPMIAGNYSLALYILSDSYLGLDQQYDIPLLIEGTSSENEVHY